MQIVSTLCDLCHATGEDEVAIDTVVVAINKKATELDLCQAHIDEINARLEDLFDIGRRPGNLNLTVSGKAGSKTKDKDGEFGCDRCTRSFATIQGLSMHRTRSHKLMSTTNDARRKRALKAALDGHLPDDMTREEAEALIDQGMCIFEDSHGPFQGRNNVATHMRKMHGVSITELGLANPSGHPAHKGA